MPEFGLVQFSEVLVKPLYRAFYYSVRGDYLG